MSIYRVQDVEGRGPYRPGLSRKWADPNGPINKPWWVEIGKSFTAAHKMLDDPAMHYGCGFDTLSQLYDWFNRRDLRNLDRLGFKMVQIVPNVIVARTETQVVFGVLTPLAAASPRISLVSNLMRAAA